MYASFGYIYINKIEVLIKQVYEHLLIIAAVIKVNPNVRSIYGTCSSSYTFVIMSVVR